MLFPSLVSVIFFSSVLRSLLLCPFADLLAFYFSKITWHCSFLTGWNRMLLQCCSTTTTHATLFFFICNFFFSSSRIKRKYIHNAIHIYNLLAGWSSFMIRSDWRYNIENLYAACTMISLFSVESVSACRLLSLDAELKVVQLQMQMCRFTANYHKYILFSSVFFFSLAL